LQTQPIAKIITGKIGLTRCQAVLGITELTSRDQACCLGIDLYKENLNKPSNSSNPLSYLSPCGEQLKTAPQDKVIRFINHVCKSSDCSEFLALSHARFPAKNAEYDEGVRHIETKVRSWVYRPGENRLPTLERQYPTIYDRYTDLTRYIKNTDASELWKGSTLQDLSVAFMLEVNRKIHFYETLPHGHGVDQVHTLLDYLKSADPTLHTADGYPMDLLHDTLIHIDLPWDDYRYRPILHIKHYLKIPIRYGNTWKTL
jgi:hypothetical protein